MENKDLLYVHKVLDNPALTQTKEFRIWMQNKEHRELFWNTKATLDNVLLKNESIPNILLEWDRFKKTVGEAYEQNEEHTFIRKNFKNILRWSSAAIFLLLLGMGTYLMIEPSDHPKPIILVQALPNLQKVILNNYCENDTTELSTKNGRKKTCTKNRYYVIHTPRGKDFKVTLSDGTEILLNSESSLRYPTCFSGKERIVELKGEAYFKVAKNKNMPFVVKTDILQTRVLGTEFNVRAYPYSKSHVTLIEGSIAVKATNHENTVILNPGEDVYLADETQTFKIQSVDIRNYTAWTNGFLFFENAYLEDIMRELGRWYNVNVEFIDPKAMKYQFNFWVNRNCDIQEALDLLREINKVQITYKGNTVTIS